MEQSPQRPASADRVSETREQPARPACPSCGGPLFEVRAKLQCARCRTICETCCEGGRG